MDANELLRIFTQFGLVGVLGFLVGLERQMGAVENPHTGPRDFVMFALVGAVSAFAADLYASSFLVLAGFLGFLAMLLSGYWRGAARTPGVTAASRRRSRAS